MFWNQGPTDAERREKATDIAACIACKFCGMAPMEFERGVRKYEARIAKLITMWEVAEHKKTIEHHSSEEYRRAHMYDHLGAQQAPQATPEQLAAWQQAAAWGNQLHNDWVNPNPNSNIS